MLLCATGLQGMLTKRDQRWKGYALAGTGLALALLLTLVLDPLQDKRPYLLFFPAIMACAWWGGLLLALGAIVLSAVAVHLWVLAPDSVWAITLTEGIQMGVFVAIAGGMSGALSALMAARTRFAVTLASIGDAVIVTDRQGRVTFLNDVATALTGWTAPDAYGRDVADVFPIVNMHTRQAVENPVTRVLREGHIVGLANHTVLLAKDGTERPIDDSGAPVRTPAGELLGVVLVFRDVTERWQAEEARTRLAAIVESSEDAIIGKTLDGIITDWNQGAERLYGYTAAEMVGQPIARLIPPDLADDLPAILARLRQGERIAHYETQRIARDGTRRDVALTISPIRDGAGQLIGASKIARDITARKQAEAELERRRQETALLAEIAQRLSASLDLDTVLQRVVTGAQELCGSERVFLALRKPDSDTLVGRYEVGAPQMAYAGFRIVPGAGMGG
jgi:PAS domain S-box-containing protein